LIAKPFFDKTLDGSMYTTNSSGSDYAAAIRNRILADAIPALTLPAGANIVTNLDVRAGEQRNFDMQATFENGWPSGRPARQAGATAPGEWHHSDVKVISYQYIHGLFDTMVLSGGLQ
jgi:hypothetical protein